MLPLFNSIFMEKMMISDTLFEAVEEINEYLDKMRDTYSGPMRGEIIDLRNRMDEVRKKLDAFPKIREFIEHIKYDDCNWVLSNIDQNAYSNDELSELSTFPGSLEKNLALKVFNDICNVSVSKIKLGRMLRYYGFAEDRVKLNNGKRIYRYVWHT